MEMLFNELSVEPLSGDIYEANKKMELFARTVGEARKRNFRNIRSYHDTNNIKLADDYSLYDWLHKKEVPELYRNFIYGMIIRPFINEEDEEVEEHYITSNYYFESIDPSVPKTETVGLAAAYLYETLSISLSSMFLWDEVTLPIIIESDEDGGLVQNVFNVSRRESFEQPVISEFVEKLGVVEIIETDIEPGEKKIHFSDHHGKDELRAFADKLKLSPYVVEMRGTNWGGKKFIRKIYKDGTLEIVLTNSSRSYALWVQTTGRNMRETNAIAEILTTKYS
ncbi:hypothetical protein [Sediminibacter sp. Hel_I_10]|uniref:hypothetical protein n=1 Tax=Sediminibacter sp. Hel_I_10 TaxID=1392490 RepID=UPI00047C748C|nr:hypothetical protein [Sediminibacter sp. Hel_I_10]